MLGTSLPRLLVTSAIFVAGFAGISIPVASAQVQSRIGAVSASNPIEVPNSVNPRAKLATDLGPTAPDTKLVGMSVRFSMTADQGAALDQLLADQQNPSSPRYHQWLTPAQFAAQFGLSSSDIAKVTAWLASEGFTVTGVANGGTFVTFNGTVAQAQTAFSTSIHNLSLNGEAHFANITNISVPGALAGVVSDVAGLHNFRLQPRVHTSIVKPEFTSSVSSDHFVAPGDIYTIYNVNGLLNASPAINGAGQTIAVTGQVDIYPADIAAFRSAAGISAINLTTRNAGVDPGAACTNPNQALCFPLPNEGDLEESTIDLEWSGAMAPSATVLFVNAPCILPGSGCGTDAMSYVIDNNLAPIVTTSYGACEAGWGTADLITVNALFKQANAQGQTVMAAAGDTGATDCDPQTVTSAVEGLNVDFPGSSPYVTSMGGTMFNEGITTGATAYWTTTNGAVGQGSALSYIPETVFNDSSFDNFGGGGGGPSGFFTKPAWQVGTPADGARDVPDLSLDASGIHDGLLYCVNTAAAQGAETCGSGFRVSSSNDGLATAGGTSFDSQMFGGMLALVMQKIGSRIGNANPTLYALGNNATYSTAVFNDVTVGNNAMPCTQGTPDCPNGGTTGFNAGTGYDLATGWGSVNLAKLASDWTQVTPLSSGSLGVNTTTTGLTTTLVSTAPDVFTLVATVTGSAGATPTGTVLFRANNTSLGSAVPVIALNPTTATATYSWTAGCSNLGQQVMSAYYSGDTNYQGSVGGPQLTLNGASPTSTGAFPVSPVEVQVVASSCPDFSVSPSTSTVSVATGTSAIPGVTITVTPANGFTGTVVFSATGLNTNQYGYIPILSFSPASVNVTSSAAVTTTLNVSSLTVEANLQSPSTPAGSRTPVQRTPGATPWYAAGSGVTVASLLLLMLPRRRRLGGLLLLAMAVALIGGATGCGSSQAGPPTTTTTNPSDPASGTYQVTVVGKYTNSNGEVTTHLTTVTYTVN